MEEYVESLTQKISQLGMGQDDMAKVAEAFAQVDKRKTGSLDIDELGSLLEAAGKPLPGFKIRQILPGVKTATPGEINVVEFGKVKHDTSTVLHYNITLLWVLYAYLFIIIS